MQRRFQMVDVFHSGNFTGNPVAVVLDSQGLTTEDMQCITRWFNLSETTFLLPPETPEADYRVRIFTLDRELPFAGHPTLGSAHAWKLATGSDKTDIVQQCAVGLVPVAFDGDRPAFAAPPLLKSGPVDEAKIAEIVSVLRIAREDIIKIEWADNGPGWVLVQLASADAVLAVDAVKYWDNRIEIGLVGAHPVGHETAFEVRALFSDAFGGIMEDPVTGSLNAAVAQCLLADGRATAPYVAGQGTKLGRAGRVYVTQADGDIWIGGETRTLFSGTGEF
ncbi:PhzF family phenazine biosynthesis protein [Asticcacaulis sp. BYS171W]|uniref:PhzF family phenazine biosynthesis protein n=1 Tax=Asticcacaulis aquaticus TaxID=2984212 RepID=A0ABT5HPN4_9CAUL|nr:PhzF family phenazine biosynthesis protein [Asticcacaulis aquaticus]MDC7682016.1 PhzF family phenazine biosynthesis protein [Asticcacaulis aquaticus]